MQADRTEENSPHRADLLKIDLKRIIPDADLPVSDDPQIFRLKGLA